METGGKKVADQLRDLGITAGTWYALKRKYGGLEVSEAKRLKELEQENSRLKRMVANLMRWWEYSSEKDYLTANLAV